jgi:plasmid stability protein
MTTSIRLEQVEETVSRLTITLDDSLHQALKVAAARQGRSIGKLIEEGLILRGIKPTESARQLVARARRNADCSEDEALLMANAVRKT